PHGEATPRAYSGPGSDHFLARYALGLEESLTTEVSRLPVQGSVAGRAVRSGITQVVEDTTDEPEVIFPRLAGKVLRSLVAVPLAVGDQMLGVLSAYSDRPHAFNSEAVQLLEAFGAQASTAISN